MEGVAPPGLRPASATASRRDAAASPASPGLGQGQKSASSSTARACKHAHGFTRSMGTEVCLACGISRASLAGRAAEQGPIPVGRALRRNHILRSGEPLSAEVLAALRNHTGTCKRRDCRFCAGTPDNAATDDSSSRLKLATTGAVVVSAAKPTWAELTVKALDAVLHDRAKLNSIVAKYWKQFAGFDAMGDARLSLASASEMANLLAAELGIPPNLFADMANLFTVFDFNGDGSLDKRECMKMYRTAMRQRRILLGGRITKVDVPASTIEDMGYHNIKLLGKGGQGSMYLVIHGATSKYYCLKTYGKEDENAGGIEACIDEFELMREFHHGHVARTFDMFQDSSFYYLVNEPYYGGDFTKLTSNAWQKGAQMSERWWRNIYAKVLSGLDYLHDHAIIHCDLKEPNIMVAKDDCFSAPQPVLIDFGLAQPFSKWTGSVGGTPGYIPPEAYEMGFWRPRGDVFSLGVVFFQLLSGRVPGNGGLGPLQTGATDFNDYHNFAKSKPLPWDEFPGCLPGLRELIESMTDRSFDRRPRVPQCRTHAWFNSASDVVLPLASLHRLCNLKLPV